MSRKYMDIKEFADLGILHEINRLMLHPVGLALEIQVNDETGEHRLSGVWDVRDDPEGIVFAEPSAEKALRFAEFKDSRKAARIEALGFDVQTVINLKGQ